MMTASRISPTDIRNARRSIGCFFLCHLIKNKIVITDSKNAIIHIADGIMFNKIARIYKLFCVVCVENQIRFLKMNLLLRENDPITF